MKFSVKILNALFLCAIALSSQSYAATRTDNVCSKTPGHWKGLFVMKDESKCASHNGCAHFVSTEITDLGNNAYQALLQPDLTGAGGPVQLDCNNGKLTSPNFPKGTVIHMNCSANNECTMNTETPFIFAYLHKAE